MVKLTIDIENRKEKQMTSMLTKFETACFTGHRPKSLSYLFDESDERYISLKQELKETIIKAIKTASEIPMRSIYLYHSSPSFLAALWTDSIVSSAIST